MLSYNEFYELILSDYAISQRIVYIIDEEGKEHLVESQFQLLSQECPTIKVEGMERYNEEIFDYTQTLREKYKHSGPITCHAFRSHPNSPSFPTHTDPDDVVLLMLKGRKDIVVNGLTTTLYENDTHYISAGTPHKAINTHESLMLSFGMEQYIKAKVNHELDVLSQNY